jgi:polysaccharide biosynthesis protein PslH
MRGLWITRALPFPLDTGDRIYSARLMRSVAEAGADLTVVGFAPQPADAVPAGGSIRWRTVGGAPHGAARALASTMPLVAAAHATPAYRREIAALAQQDWDFVVFDQYGTGWAMAPFLRRRTRAGAPVLVHIAHDHEASVYASLVRGFKGSPIRRLGLWQNWLKTRRLERRIARSVDLVTAITTEDAARFAADAPHTASVVLTPGYDGAVSARARIDASVPRRVVMVGNYNWVAKSENLRQFVAAADASFHAHGIVLDVVGSMSDPLAQELRCGTKATVLHGFVDDIAPIFANARIAVVPEEIGGGFKLKFLDYIFGRVAVASLSHATAGLPDEIRRAMICCDDLPALVRAIIARIDDTDALTALQDAALSAAQARYRWADRGRDLRAAVRRVGRQRADKPSAAAGGRKALP